MPKGVLIIPMFLIGVIFLDGLVNVLNPKLKWKLFESWKATKEPSSAYFLSRRITGIVEILLVVSLFLFPYIMSKQ